MKVVYAWCGKEMKRGTGEPERRGTGKEPVSHGICPKCAKKLRAEAKALREKKAGCRIKPGMMKMGDFEAGESLLTPPGLSKQVSKALESRD